MAGTPGGIRTHDLRFRKGVCGSGIGDPTQANAGHDNELAPDCADQADPSKPTCGHSSGPQSGPHSEAPTETTTSSCAALPPDLSRLISIWPTLPANIRAAILEVAEQHAGAAEPHGAMGRLAWLMLPEETRASIVESIGNAMKNLLEGEEREVKALNESMERELRHINEHTRASDE